MSDGYADPDARLGMPPQRPGRNGPSWPHMRAISALILREMGSSYGRNPGGYIWAVVEPLGMILFLSVGFSLMLRSPSLGNSFVLYYASGYLPFILFQKSARVVMNALRFSSNLLTYPTVTWIDAITARFVLCVLTETLVSYLLLGGILMVVDMTVIIDFTPIILAYTISALMGLGFGLINCVISAFVPIYTTVWNILTRPLMLASGVIVMHESLPSSMKVVSWYNPLTHITATARSGIYVNYEPHFTNLGYPIAIGLITTAFGLLLMRRYYLEIIARR